LEGAIAAYEQGLRLYRARDFEAAKVWFQKAAGENGLDGPSRMYVERCEELAAKPPAPDWDGVFVMTHK
jgi:hypothetical protein